MEDSDVQQQIKKRARRRLVGAVFFASLVAVVPPGAEPGWVVGPSGVFRIR